MPLLSDYLFAPWKILGFFGDRTPKSLGSPAAGGGLCSTVSSGDVTLHVCQVFGYSMPSFIFWASLAILALFVVSSLMLAVQCRALAESISRAARALEALQLAPGRGVPEASVSAISAVMRREPALAGPWSGFEETLLQPAPGGEVFATRPLEEAFERARVIEHSVDVAYFGSVPGILTGVGLLMTFVAILDGLSHVSVSATMDVTGIGGLINGLSGKFVSSVTAVSCAVLFVFVERMAYARPRRALERLLTQLRGRFRRRTTEQLLLEIHERLAARAELR